MIILLSPAKTLDYSSPLNVSLDTSIPIFEKETNQLVRILKKLDVNEIKSLMHLSDKLAILNEGRYKEFNKKYDSKNSRAAIMAFKGDVYTGLDTTTLSKEDLIFTNNHVRILSGLYGILKPNDAMQPYRLEMGTKLTNKHGSNLYHFWGDKISNTLNKNLKAQGTDVIVNLASNEYFKVINQKKLKAKVLDIDFREIKNGELKFVSFFAKKARGLMTRFIIDHQITNPLDLRGFDYENYRYNEEGSTEDKYSFIR
ncbi:MAG: peroxide stress protein YaaA [Saprospiraceae bacterium]